MRNKIDENEFLNDQKISHAFLNLQIITYTKGAKPSLDITYV